MEDIRFNTIYNKKTNQPNNEVFANDIIGLLFVVWEVSNSEYINLLLTP